MFKAIYFHLPENYYLPVANPGCNHYVTVLYCQHLAQKGFVQSCIIQVSSIKKMDTTTVWLVVPALQMADAAKKIG